MVWASDKEAGFQFEYSGSNSALVGFNLSSLVPKLNSTVPFGKYTIYSKSERRFYANRG